MGENVLKFGTYVRVGNAAEAYELLQKNRNNKIVGGGIWMRLGSRRVATAIDLSACGLDQIEETETEFRIGAMCTLRQLERHAELNALVNHVFEFAVHDIVGVQLRNTATVGGSIYGRFGFSDVLSAFLALDSYVELTGAGRVPLAEFVDMGYVRDVIEYVVVVKHDYRASYEAVRKAATDFPSLNVTAAWWDNSWHVTVGARPLRATLLQGEACGLVNEQPSEDELRALADSGHIDAARERLMDALSNYAAFTRREVVVVFDGYRVPGGQGEKFDRSGLHVVFTRQGETADAYMEKLADEIGKNESVRVVTSDALIQLTALRAGVLRMSAREFRQELAQVAQQLEAAIRDINGR